MIISLKNIAKSYGNAEVIKGLNLRMEDKEFTTLLGPSGCGKTTVLRMIAGLETPTAGEIYFDDTCVYSAARKISVPPEKRRIGFVFQDFALWPHLTVFENVAFGLRARGDTADLARRVTEALDAVRLAGFAGRYPQQLSGGQQQRVGFARAMVTKPDCILFDEPLSALDAILREDMRLEIKRLTAELGVTAVFVTHDQMEAMSMSDRIVVLNQGAVEQQGRPEDIYQKPATVFAARFIGRSNWLGPDKMFRPEQASLEPQAGWRAYDAVVDGVQFLGEHYRLYLNAGGARWLMDSPRRRDIGARVAVYIKEDHIISF